jgi:hypothetical protein
MKIVRWEESYLGIDIYPMLEQDEPLTFVGGKADYKINVRTHAPDFEQGGKLDRLLLPDIHISATVGLPLDVDTVKKIHAAIAKAIEIAAAPATAAEEFANI